MQGQLVEDDRGSLHPLIRSTRQVNLIRPTFLPSSCSATDGVEGSVVGLLVLDRGDHSDGAVQSGVFLPVDPGGGGVLDVGQGLVGAVVEDRGADALGLVKAVDRLHQAVVVDVADSADRGLDAFEVEVLGVNQRRVLTARIQVEDQLTAGWRVAVTVPLPQRHPQRRHHQLHSLARRGVPGDDALGEHVDYEGGA